MNVSHELNKLVQSEEVRKTAAHRPVLYQVMKDKPTDILDEFLKSNPNLYNAVEQIKAAVLYPPSSLSLYITRYYNMMYMIEEDTHYYRCHDGRRLDPIRTETSRQDGYTRTIEVCGCEDCSECEHKAKCLYKYDAEKDSAKNKVMKVNENWEELWSESHANIQSEQGILNWQIRSTQTEGAFGDIKENNHFRRFHYRSSEKSCKEFMLHAIGRNINKSGSILNSSQTQFYTLQYSKIAKVKHPLYLYFKIKI